MSRETHLQRVGIVVIGRNEGERLMACLASLRDLAQRVVYVDSGSMDDSVRAARALGASVVELDRHLPFTAARARNEGFRHLRRLAPDVDYVQFVDGDCELVSGWLARAAAWLDDHPELAVVCGRRRERHLDRSIYNRLCDIEWNTPVGQAKACGGDAMMRLAAFDSAGGYRDDLIAGEEPELCLRLRAAGWRIWRLDADMTLHDAAMERFGQWWKRALRNGFALAQGADLHGRSPEKYCVRQSCSIWFWSAGVPLLAIALALQWGPWALLLLLVYPAQIIRLWGARGPLDRRNWWYAVFLVLGKFPEFIGQLKYLAHRRAGGKPRLIEYK